MNTQKLNLINEKIFNSCYNNFETRTINGRKYTVMPPVEFLPKNINLEYDKENDKIILSVNEVSQHTDMLINKISIVKDENDLINKIEYNGISTGGQKEKRQEINECIQKFNQKESKNILFYDLNLRLLELFKRVILNFTMEKLENKW
jgi:hypothetical protein